MIPRVHRPPGLWLGLGAAVLVALWLGVTLAGAQDPAPAGDPAPAQGLIDPLTGELPTLARLYMFSPIINSVIAALSVVALLLFLYFMLSIRTSSLAPPSLVDVLTNLVVAGKFEEAASVCRNHRNIFVANVVQRCAENAGKQHSVIMDMIDSEGRRRADIIWNRNSYLADISNVTPMLGLLGTVIGMIKGFFLLPQESMSVSSRLLSESIGQAMSTTMFGLMVAILALFFYSIIKSRTTRALAETEQIVHSIADHIKRGDQ